MLLGAAGQGRRRPGGAPCALRPGLRCAAALRLAWRRHAASPSCSLPPAPGSDECTYLALCHGVPCHTCPPASASAVPYSFRIEGRRSTLDSQQSSRPCCPPAGLPHPTCCPSPSVGTALAEGTARKAHPLNCTQSVAASLSALSVLFAWSPPREPPPAARLLPRPARSCPCSLPFLPTPSLFRKFFFSRAAQAPAPRLPPTAPPQKHMPPLPSLLLPLTTLAAHP